MFLHLEYILLICSFYFCIFGVLIMFLDLGEVTFRRCPICPRSTLLSDHQSYMCQGVFPCKLHGSFCCSGVTTIGDLQSGLFPGLPSVEVSDCWWASWGHEAACCRIQGTSELVLAYLWVELPFKVDGCRAGHPRCGINLFVGRACFFYSTVCGV